MPRMLGQITLFALDFAPAGWAVCDGRLLAIPEHSELDDLLGTRFGGDGRETFGLPDLRNSAPSGCNYCISLEGYPYRENPYMGVVGETLLSVIPKPADSEECAGQSFRTNQHLQLFTYIGKRFGGDGVNTYKLPNLEAYLRTKFPDNCYYLMYVEGLSPESERQEPLFLGELTLLPFEVTVKGSGLCNGALMQKKDNQALFDLLKNRFGGDGVNNFKLPNLVSVAPTNFNYYITLKGALPPRF